MIAEHLESELSAFNTAVWVHVSPVNYLTSNCKAFINRNMHDTDGTHLEFTNWQDRKKAC